MFSFLTDEDFNGRILRGVLRQNPDLDIRRVQDVGLQEAADDVILKWAAEQGRLLLSHDARTMPREAFLRLEAGLHFPGIFIVDDSAPIGACISDILWVAQCSTLDEWQDQVYYLPLK